MQRNYSIDILKIICAVLVVFIHAEYAYKDLVLPLTRCAVPCFFMISGYLMYKEEMQSSIVKSLKRISLITLWSSLTFYFFSAIVVSHNLGLVFPSKQDLFNLVLFNDYPFAFHLWYLYAYIYVLIITYVFNRCHKINWLFYLIPILLIGDLCFGKYSLLLWGREFNYLYVRNFLFVGLPYFSLGMLLRRYDNKLLYVRLLQWGGVIAFSVTSLMEYNILEYLNINAARDHYISSTFLAISLFSLFVFSKPYNFPMAAKLGKEVSLYIYILHPMVMYLCGAIVYKYPDLQTIYQWLAPIIIIVITFSLCIILFDTRIISN